MGAQHTICRLQQVTYSSLSIKLFICWIFSRLLASWLQCLVFEGVQSFPRSDCTESVSAHLFPGVQIHSRVVLQRRRAGSLHLFQVHQTSEMKRQLRINIAPL